MTIIDSSKHERQRFEHLALGRDRPAPELPKKPKGKSKAEWKVQKAALLAAGSVLAPGVEQWVGLRERWSHKAQGTPETHEAASRALMRPGSLARLYATGAIDRDQLDAADQIREAHRTIFSDVPCRTASWEMRTGGSGHGNADLPHIEMIQAQFAYDWWLRALAGPAHAIIMIIVEDVGLTAVAAQFAMSPKRLRTLLAGALDLWLKNQGSTHRGRVVTVRS